MRERTGVADAGVDVAWEYRFTSGWPFGKGHETLARELAELGAEGWEAVGMTPIGPTGDRVTILLKRRRPGVQSGESRTSVNPDR